MFKKLMLVSAVALSLAANAQDSKKGFYLKAGGSYFIQTVPTNFPEVAGNKAEEITNVNGKEVSRSVISGSFGQGFRTNLVGGFRFTERLGVEMGVHYYSSESKTMFKRTDNVVGHPVLGNRSHVTEAKGVVRALDLSPSVVLYLGEVNKFEPYTKVGVIVPVYGSLTISVESKGDIPGQNQISAEQVIKPQPTLGFMSAIGTSYKITSNLSAFGEIEYRNFTVKGKSSEITKNERNGVNVLPFMDYSDIHTNYVDTLDANSNQGANPNVATDELASRISISGVGLTLGMRYNF